MLHEDTPVAFAFSSIFLRAARIISSRLRCRLACLSFRSCDHFFCCCDSDEGSSGAELSFDFRLYRVIKSGCVGFEGVAARRVGRGCGCGGLKEGGGCIGSEPWYSRMWSSGYSQYQDPVRSTPSPLSRQHCLRCAASPRLSAAYLAAETCPLFG